jgi:hydroxyacylglutathione hydrolase
LREPCETNPGPTVEATARPGGDKRIGDDLNIPLNRLVQRLDDLPRDRPVLLHCATGYRSAIGASLLLCDGLREVADLVGGITA